MFHPMKPETAARKAREHKAEQERNTANLTARLKAQAEKDGPDSLAADLLAYHLSAQAA